MRFIILLIFILLGIYLIAYFSIDENNTIYESSNGEICKVLFKTLSYVTISTTDMCYDISLLKFILFYKKHID